MNTPITWTRTPRPTFKAFLSSWYHPLGLCRLRYVFLIALKMPSTTGSYLSFMEIYILYAAYLSLPSFVSTLGATVAPSSTKIDSTTMPYSRRCAWVETRLTTTKNDRHSVMVWIRDTPESQMLPIRKRVGVSKRRLATTWTWRTGYAKPPARMIRRGEALMADT